MSIRKVRRMTVRQIASMLVITSFFQFCVIHIAFPLILLYMPLFKEIVVNQFCFMPFTRAPVEFSHPDAHL